MEKAVSHLIKRGSYDPLSKPDKAPTMQGFHIATQRDFAKKRPVKIDRYLIEGENVSYADMSQRLDCEDRFVRTAFKKAKGMAGPITWERLRSLTDELKSKQTKRPTIYSE